MTVDLANPSHEVRGQKRKRHSRAARTKHAAAQDQRDIRPEDGYRNGPEDQQLLSKSVIARFYPLVLTLADYTRRAFGIDLFDGHTPNLSARALSRFAVGVADEESALLPQHDEPSMASRFAGPSSSAFRRDPIREVVHRAQLAILNSIARDALPISRKTNVLTLGYSRPDERSTTFNVLAAGRAGLANLFPNTLVTTINTRREWSYLLDRIGDDNFYRLLTKTAVFAPLLGGNGSDGSCFVQMCGQPLSEMAERREAIASAPVEVASMRSREQADNTIRPARHGRKRKRGGSRIPPLDGAPAELDHRAGTLTRTASAASSATQLDGQAPPSSSATRSQAVRSHSQIAFVRSRIFYARPIRGKKGKVELGLPFVHVLHRSASPSELFKAISNPRPPKTSSSRDDQKQDQTFAARRCRHILKYVFPRQFGLHNVFTTPKDSRTTSQPLHDYTTREKEIRSRGRVRTPNRLRPVLPLIAILMRRHDRLDYRQILDRCCPSRLPRRRLTSEDKEKIANDLTEQPVIEVPAQFPNGGATLSANSDGGDPVIGRLANTRSGPTVNAPIKRDWQQPSTSARTEPKPRFAQYAVPASGQVVHFVTTVVRRLVPIDVFGSRRNQRLVLRTISHFVRARRFETTTLHQALQGLRVTDTDWTLPPGQSARWQRPTASESAKRRELLAEFIYWLFDSLVVPLLRTTFYATESAAFRNRVLYFRQDDWHAISRPLLDKLKTTVFEPLTRSEALAVMSSRKLGYSHIRLLPKETGVRPIVNLRRRSTRQLTIGSGGLNGADLLKRKKESERLGQSINFILQSAFHILTYEKKRCISTDALGASVFGPNEIYVQLKRFRRELDRTPSLRLGKGGRRKLYFVKVDVKCAFDSIDQDRLVEIIKQILSEKDGYLIHRFAKVMPASASSAGAKTKRAFVKLAQPDSSQRLFIDLATELAAALHHVVFVDSVVYRHEERSRVLNLLQQHVMGNLVKISGDFYRQKVGIPQGSSLSTMLCSFFYAHLEKTKLTFVNEPGSLLMRYTDDFLFVTTSKRKAKTFYKVMYEGHEEYGCFIAREKTLVNFDLRQPDASDGTAAAAAAAAGGKPFVERCTSEGFPWCGMLLNTSTLAVAPDLGRYRNVAMRDTLTIEPSRRPGAALIEKLFQATRSRCHILYTDTSLNTQHGAYGNLYSSFLIAALKFEAYLDECRLVGVAFHAEVLVDAIAKLVRSTATAVARRAKAAKTLHREASCVVETEWIHWLGHHAFLRVLTTRHLRDPTRRRRLSEPVASVVRHLSSSSILARPSLAYGARLRLANRVWAKAAADLGWV